MSEDRIVALAACFLCGHLFEFDAELVPSVPIDPVTGLTPDLGGDAERATNQPLCQSCIKLVNAKRIALGREPWPVLEGAYP